MMVVVARCPAPHRSLQAQAVGPPCTCRLLSRALQPSPALQAPCATQVKTRIKRWVGVGERVSCCFRVRIREDSLFNSNRQAQFATKSGYELLWPQTVNLGGEKAGPATDDLNYFLNRRFRCL